MAKGRATPTVLKVIEQSEEQTVTSVSRPAETVPVAIAPSPTSVTLPALLDAYARARGDAERTPLERHLTEVLWETRPDDASALDPARRRPLRDALRRSLAVPDTLTETGSDFLVAAAKALTIAADRDTLPLLERWQKARVTTPNARVLQAAAAEFAPLLKAEMTCRAARRTEIEAHLNHAIEYGANREELEAALDAMGPDAARTALREIVEEGVMAARRERRNVLRLRMSWATFTGLAALVTPTSRLLPTDLVFSFGLQMMFCGILLVGWAFGQSRRLRSGFLEVPPPERAIRPTRAAVLLTRYAGKSELETLILALRYGGPTREVTEKIASLLRRLSDDDKYLLTSELRSYLEFLLTEWRGLPIELRSAIVHALHEPARRIFASVSEPRERGGDGSH